MNIKTQTIDGGPAFPTMFEGGQNNGESPYFEMGMTLRDWFAGQALACMATHRMTAPFEAGQIAQSAYLIADAMLAAREGGDA